MLRRLDIKEPYRSLTEGFWPTDKPLGKRTVIYGHNGSGKSTLSDLLLDVASASSPVELIWEEETLQTQRIRGGDNCPSPSMAVFTKTWVQRNLSEFLDGRNASAIVTLGQDAIDAKEEEQKLEHEIADLRQTAQTAEGKRKEHDRKLEQLARGVQDAIASQLREFDYQRFSKNKYALPKVKEDLTRYKGDFPSDNEHAEALKRLGERVPDPVAPIAEAPTIVLKVAGLSTLLGESPTRLALAALEGDPKAQSWVEQGIALHTDLDECLFCTGQITESRKEQLAQHFDESWLQLRQRATLLLEQVRREQDALRAWLSSLPAADDLVSDLRDAYAEGIAQTTAAVYERADLLTKIEAAVEQKVEDPSATPDAPDCAALDAPPSTTVISQAVTEHNEQAATHTELVERHVVTVLDHLIGSKSEAFRDLTQQLDEASTRSSTSKQTADLAQRNLDALRRKQFSSSAMADTLTKDLARVYGRNHLSVAVTGDGKSYSCRRGEVAATNLSEGERTTLSLLYFLRKLEDETDGTSPDQRIVVVDDPSSSLDREAVFATHQWLLDTLGRFGQFIVLTHDFSLLRLFIKSQNTGWGSSLKRIRQGNVDERNFPTVSFLEMYASTQDPRRTLVTDLPTMLRNNTSEYAYLFSMVMAGVGDPDDHNRLFLLPNAARRVLEIFASYKAPHESKFDRQLKTLMEEVGNDPYRDVYDFCNRYSHGEGNESVDVLDARTVQSQIRRCMEFLRSVDADHFARMCTATSTDPTVLP